MFMIKMCECCFENNVNEWNVGDICGFFEAFSPNDNICPFCNSILTDTNFSYDEFKIIKQASDDRSFIKAMIKLKETDIIEYQLKISQFKTQLEQKNVAEQRQVEKNTPKCPTCSSVNIDKISATAKVAGAVAFGLFSKTAKSQFKCNNCGAKW